MAHVFDRFSKDLGNALPSPSSPTSECTASNSVDVSIDSWVAELEEKLGHNADNITLSGEEGRDLLRLLRTASSSRAVSPEQDELTEAEQYSQQVRFLSCYGAYAGAVFNFLKRQTSLGGYLDMHASDLAKVLERGELEQDGLRELSAQDRATLDTFSHAANDFSREEGINRQTVEYAVKMYGIRNKMFHRQAGGFKSRRDFDTLAKCIKADLKDLASMLPAEHERYRHVWEEILLFY